MAEFTYDFPLRINVLGRIKVEADDEIQSWDKVLDYLDNLGAWLSNDVLHSLKNGPSIYNESIIDDVYSDFESIDVELVDEDES